MSCRLKEKGILEELQVFLRAKMVEKLQGTCLRSIKKISGVSSTDHAMNMIVCDYLRQSQMHYTLSVFASECPSLQSLSSLSDSLIRENVYSVLKIENLSEKVGKPSQVNEQCILQDLVNACSVMCTKMFQSRHSQHQSNQETSKLFINTQSQTEPQKISLTKGAQTKITCNLGTQTDIKGSSDEDKITTEEMAKLHSQLEASKTMLKSCQLELQESRRTIEHLVNNSLKFSLGRGSCVVPDPAHEFSTRFPNHILDQSDYDQRIKESQQFLGSLKNRLEYLDEKYFTLTGKKDMKSVK